MQNQIKAKSFLASKTLWGVVVAVLPQLIEAADAGLLGPQASAVVSAAGGALAVYGRFKAKQPLQVSGGGDAGTAGTSLLLVAAMLLAVIGGAGCATTGNEAVDTARRDALVQVAVTYGTAKVLEKNPTYAARVAEIAGHIKATASGDGFATVDAAIAAARGLIDWSKLSQADQTLVNSLLGVVRAELIARLGEGQLPVDRLVVVAQVAGWIEATALSYVPEA